MDHLLIVPLKQNLSENLLASLRQAGWRITVTVDIVRAKQLLQQGDINGVVIEFDPARHDPDRLKVLRYVHEFCPSALVIMLHSGPDALTSLAGTKVLHALDTMDDVRTDATPRVSLDLYNLTPAQKRIAELVAQAYPNREIARKLQIKEQSVRNELSRIFKKMGVWNRVELALLMRNDSAGATEANGSKPWVQMKPAGNDTRIMM